MLMGRMSKQRLFKTVSIPRHRSGRQYAQSAQQGYVLLMAMMLLILVATPFFYQATMQSANEMQRDQYQKIEGRLNDLKEQMILFAKYPGLFCSDASNTNADHLNYLYRFDQDDFAASDFGQFLPYSENIVAEWLGGSEAYGVECDNFSNSNLPSGNACQHSQELLVRLAWKDEQTLDEITARTPVVYVYKKDLGC
jgi:hypothetical protein